MKEDNLYLDFYYPVIFFYDSNYVVVWIDPSNRVLRDRISRSI